LGTRNEYSCLLRLAERSEFQPGAGAPFIARFLRNEWAMSGYNRAACATPMQL